MLYDIVLEGGMGSFIGRLRRHDDPGVRLALNTFLDPHGGKDFDLQRVLADKGLAASYSTMTARLGPFLTPGVRYLFRRSDFRAADLMGQKPCTIYVQWPEATLESSLAVYDLVMTGLLRGMIRHVDVALEGEPPTTPVFMGLDEIYKAPITNLPGDLSTASGRDIVIALYCQTLGQLRAAFGQGDSETILDNCAVKLFYKTEGPEVAQYISSLAHKVSRTEERRSRRWRIIPEMPTVSEGNQSREVIAPDEVLLVGGEDRELLIAAVTGKPLMIAKRVDVREEPKLQRLMKKHRAPAIKQVSEEELEHASTVPTNLTGAAPESADKTQITVVQPQDGDLTERIKSAAEDLDPPQPSDLGEGSETRPEEIEEADEAVKNVVIEARRKAAIEKAAAAARKGESGAC